MRKVLGFMAVLLFCLVMVGVVSGQVQKFDRPPILQEAPQLTTTTTLLKAPAIAGEAAEIQKAQSAAVIKINNVSNKDLIVKIFPYHDNVAVYEFILKKKSISLRVVHPQSPQQIYRIELWSAEGADSIRLSTIHTPFLSPGEEYSRKVPHDFSFRSYELIKQWGGIGQGDGQFNRPTGVAVDPSGNVYVVDSNNNRIQKFDSNGSFIRKWWSQSGPHGIAIDPSGNVYVTDASRVIKYDSNGGHIKTWWPGRILAQQWIFLRGIASDSYGNIYVVDQAENRILKFSNSGDFIAQWDIYGEGSGPPIKTPEGIAVGSSRVFVTDSAFDSIFKFTPRGDFLKSWGTRVHANDLYATGLGGDNPYHTYPYGIACDPSGNVYVASDTHIKKYSGAGDFISWWETGTPYGVAVDPSGNFVYVTDMTTHQIIKYRHINLDTH